MRRFLVCAFTLALAAALPGAAHAQCHRIGGHRICVDDDDRHRSRGIDFGVRGGYGFEEETGSAGAQLRVPLVDVLSLEPSFDVFFDELDEARAEGVEWQANLDLLLRPRDLGGLYAGGGLALARLQQVDLDDVTIGTEAGWNAVVGIDGGRLVDTRLRPFAEARWTEIDPYTTFRLVLGVNVPIGR